MDVVNDWGAGWQQRRSIIEVSGSLSLSNGSIRALMWYRRRSIQFGCWQSPSPAAFRMYGAQVGYRIAASRRSSRGWSGSAKYFPSYAMYSSPPGTMSLVATMVTSLWCGGARTFKMDSTFSFPASRGSLMERALQLSTADASKILSGCPVSMR